MPTPRPNAVQPVEPCLDHIFVCSDHDSPQSVQRGCRLAYRDVRFSCLEQMDVVRIRRNGTSQSDYQVVNTLNKLRLGTRSRQLISSPKRAAQSINSAKQISVEFPAILILRSRAPSHATVVPCAMRNRPKF
jgi:hypothetical protein